MSDMFYTAKQLGNDRAMLLSVSLAMVAAIAGVGLLVHQSLSSRLVLQPIATVSVTPLNGSPSPKGILSVEDIKKIFEDNTKLPSNAKFEIYTASLADVCRENNGWHSGESGTIVIAKRDSNVILGRIDDNPNNCDIAKNWHGTGGNVLVTSPEPIPNVSSDRSLLAVLQ
jgi:hypothetical protein